MIDFDRDTALTQKLLDALDARAKASLHNIANQNVPGYKRYVVRFEELLQQRLSDGGSAAEVDPVVERDLSGPPGQNNVSIVDEAALLDKTRLLHEFVSRRAGGYFSVLNKAIFGR
ncbi:MAG: flagellar basal body rod protein FlgB [Planctomycetota bacterium]